MLPYVTPKLPISNLNKSTGTGGVDHVLIQADALTKRLHLRRPHIIKTYRALNFSNLNLQHQNGWVMIVMCVNPSVTVEDIYILQELHATQQTFVSPSDSEYSGGNKLVISMSRTFAGHDSFSTHWLTHRHLAKICCLWGRTELSKCSMKHYSFTMT